jgi:hypothetical protein
MTDEDRARAAINAYPQAIVPPSAVAVANVVELMEAVREEAKMTLLPRIEMLESRAAVFNSFIRDLMVRMEKLDASL